MTSGGVRAVGRVRRRPPCRWWAPETSVRRLAGACAGHRLPRPGLDPAARHVVAGPLLTRRRRQPTYPATVATSTTGDCEVRGDHPCLQRVYPGTDRCPDLALAVPQRQQAPADLGDRGRDLVPEPLRRGGAGRGDQLLDVTLAFRDPAGEVRKLFARVRLTLSKELLDAGERTAQPAPRPDLGERRRTASERHHVGEKGAIVVDGARRGAPGRIHGLHRERIEDPVHIRNHEHPARLPRPQRR